MERPRIALNLYLLREEAARDLPAALRVAKDCGYDGVELAATQGLEVDDLIALLAEVGLTAVSSHVPFGDFAADLPGTIDHYQRLGCSFVVLGWLEEALRHTGPGYAAVIEQVGVFARTCRAAGLPLAYHNHDFEFTAGSPDGMTQLLEALPPEVLEAQFDVGWLSIVGQNPVEWLERWAGRYRSVHLKDYFPSQRASGYDFCALGEGVMDFPPILRAAWQGGARWFIVDQDWDTVHTPAAAAAVSAQYLRQALEHVSD